MAILSLKPKLAKECVTSQVKILRKEKKNQCRSVEEEITSPNAENLSLIASCNLSSASSSVISGAQESNSSTRKFIFLTRKEKKSQ